MPSLCRTTFLPAAWEVFVKVSIWCLLVILPINLTVGTGSRPLVLPRWMVLVVVVAVAVAWGVAGTSALALGQSSAGTS